MRFRGLVTAAIAAAMTFVATTGVAFADGDGHMMDGWGSGWWIIMPIMMVIFWGGIIALAIWAVSQFTRGRGEQKSPLDIAKERLARGDISHEEFDRLRQSLS